MKKITMLFLFSMVVFVAKAQVYLPLENFNAGLGTWTTTDAGAATGDTWATGMVGGNSLNGSDVAFVDSDANGNGTHLIETLTSAAFDSSTGTVVLLEFDQYYRNGGAQTGIVEIWDGTAWVAVLTQTATIGAFNTPDVQSIDISAYKNAAMQVRFVFDDGDGWQWYWLLDNVRVVEAPTCTPLTATAVVGTTDCSGPGTFMIDVDVTDLGNATSFTISNDGGVASSNETAIGMYSVGPFTNGTNVNITVEHDQDNVCNLALPVVSYFCPPAEDICTGAIPITVGANGVCAAMAVGNNTSASDSDLDPTTPAASCSSYAGGDIWFSLVVPASGDVTISGDASPDCCSFLWYEVYEGADCTALTNVACSNTTGNNPSNFEMALTGRTPGETLYIRAWDSNNDNGPGEFNMCAFDPPSCLPVTGLAVSNVMETSAEFNWASGNLTPETAWEYTLLLATDPAPTTGTSIAVTTYTDAGLAALTDYIFYVRADCGGADYSPWEQVAFTTPGPPPANDLCVNATALVCGDAVTGSTVNATDGGSGGPDVYYSLDGTGTTSGDQITVSLCGSSFDTILNVLDACGGTSLFANDDSCALQSQVTFTSDGATTYILRVEGFSSATGSYALAVTCEPANDACASAIAINLATETAFDNTGATDSGIATCYTGTVSDVWYSFVAPTTGTGGTGEITITVGGTTQYALFSDCTTEVSCNTSANTGLVGGATYFISVTDDGSSKAPGASTLKVDDTTTLSTTDFSNGLGFSYYPNPVKNTLTLNAQQAITNVAVFNMLGQEVIRTAPNAVSKDVDMSNLQSGAYFVQVTVGTTVETVRVIKN